MGFAAVIDSPLGRIGIRLEQGRLAGLDLVDPATPLQAPAELLTGQVADQLARYFAGRDPGPLPPLSLSGTPFQRKVWKALQRIPRGQTLTYGELARQLATSPRAVGGACRRNPVPILVPCHRVVGRQDLGGYDGAVSGPVHDRKRWLLRHEGVTV